jgi:hypothetical protein
MNATAQPALVNSTATPTPTAMGPIPSTSDSYSWAHAWNVDLEAAGYVEEEYFVSGRANVYDFDNNAVVVRSANAPYTTRLLLRRPTEARRFSGRVIVEIINMTRGWDLDIQWQMQHDHFFRNGDAYIGVTSKPNAVRALKKFDPQRYAPLSWANPLPLNDSRNCERVATDSARDTENGLVWDILSQVGALLRSDSPKKPLAGYPVQRVYLVGYSQSGSMLRTYINLIQPMAKLASGKPVYDGYLVGASGGQTPINQCAAPIAAGDPRYLIMPRRVPVIAILTQSDVVNGYSSRRPDSDDPADRYRLYEVAGASHGSTYPAQFEPQTADLEKAGFTNRWRYNCEAGGIAGDFPVYMIFDGALDNLDRWVRDGTPPPRADRISLNKPGTPDAAPELDQHGNAVGGVRTPLVDVPIATYFSGSGSGECRISGHKIAFDPTTFQALYQNRAQYLSKVAQEADRLVKERWLSYADAQKIKSAAEQADIR